MKSKLFRSLSFLILLAMVVTPASARPVQLSPAEADPLFEPADATLLATSKQNKSVFNEEKYAIGPALYTVLLRQSPLASYAGGIQGLAATSPSSSGAVKLDAHTPESVAYRSYLATQQDAFIAGLEAEFQRPIEVKYRYQVVLNGFAAVLTPAEAAAIAQRPDVRLVERDGVNHLDTDVSPAWIGAPGIWDGSNTAGLPGTQGEGIIVGILDTGINSAHPSFADIGPVDGYDHTNPLPGYVGICDTTNPDYDASFVCNDKLIGAWEYAYDVLPANGYTDFPTPEDENGHGSHTASTTAGNHVLATMDAPTLDLTRSISGVAPHANIIIYDVCYEDDATLGGSCPFSATTAAAEQAILDGVDVINYSIGGGEDPYTETTELAFLEAYNAGVFVSTSAGNEGPGDATVGHRGPWVSASAAATHNRALFNSLVDMTGDGTPPADMYGKGFTSGYGPAEIIYAGDYGDPLCPLGAFAPGTFSGEIVVCDRGTYARVDKAQSVATGGAGGFVLANDVASGNSLSGDAYVIPGVHITYTDGLALKAWIADGTTHTATINGVVEDLSPANADILAAFSSRGPNTTFDVLKPNLTSPGVDIWAAVEDLGAGDEYDFYSGTSMASPHTAGAAALLKALHPEWTPAGILSALMMTADPAVRIEDGVTTGDWFDKGAGRVDLNLAAETGLILDETYANFVAADPADGGDVKTLNTASLTNSQCLQNCAWTRTFTSTAPTDVQWTVTSSPEIPVSANPAVFSIAAGASLAVEFTANAVGLTSDVWTFGTVILTPDNPEIPTLTIPVSIIPTAGVFPDLVTVQTRRDAGSQVIAGVESIEVTDLTVETFGLAQADLITASIPVDPTNSDPYDDPTAGAFFVLQEVPADAVRLVAEITASSATDVDLFVGLDDGDGLPEESELVCSSTTPTASERCDLDSPVSGTYWVLVQNWQASAEAAIDDITLALGVVSTDAGNMIVTGPDTAPELTPYDLTLYYDITESTAGDRWYGAFSLGSDSAHPGNIGMIAVDVVRQSDDVAKTVTPELAYNGDTVTYEITIDSNITPTDLIYTITDTIPDGLILDPASISVSTGSFVVDGATITWTAPMPRSYYDYAITTVDNDPLCDTGFGGYVNLEDYGILATPGISGDTVAYTAFSTANPFHFYGLPYTGMGFTDDGFAIFNAASNYGGTPWVPQTIPDPAQPNNLLAMLWQDMEIVYDAAANRGVSLATSGPDVAIIEYDDIQLYGDASKTYTFEVIANATPNDAPGAYEFVVAYNTLKRPITGPLTVGVENLDGTTAQAYVNNANANNKLRNPFMICFDQVHIGQPASMTFTATVDGVPGSTIINSAVSMTDNPGSLPESADALLQVGSSTYLADAGPDQTVDEGAEVQFAGSLIPPTDPSVPTPTSYTWDFGDGSSTVTGSLTPTHIYTDNGAYTATLTIGDASGDIDSDSVLITVQNVAPVVSLGGDASVLVGELFTRAGSFSDPGADTWTASVDYGDGAGIEALPLTGMTFDLSHTYTTAGVYTLTVTVTDDDGGEGSASITITVTEEPEDTYFLPDAGLAQTVDEGAEVQFAGSSIDPGDPDALQPTSITWDFGDGSPDVTGTLTPSHIYTDDSAYTATLTFAYADGTDSSDTVLITVDNVTPVVNIGSDAAVLVGELFSRAGSFSDPGADTWTATVDYGDGTGAQALTLTGMTFDLSHTYTTAGDYSLVVTVTDDEGGMGSAQITVTVLPEAGDTYFLPEAGTDQTVNEGTPVQFDGSMIDPGDPDALVPTSITWDFGDLGSASGSLTPTHTYLDDGAYTATLTFVYADGAEFSDTVLITVNNVAPTVYAGGNVTVLVGELFTRAGSFSDPGADTWTATVDYGDGAGAQTLNLSGMTFDLAHTYTTAGVYTLTVTVSDDDGGAGSVSVTITVLEETQAAYFLPDAGPDQTVDEGDEVQFAGSSLDPGDPDALEPTSITWDFGDSSPAISGTLTPTHVYPEAGIYTATLTFAYADGAEFSDSVVITVNVIIPTYGLYMPFIAYP